MSQGGRGTGKTELRARRRRQHLDPTLGCTNPVPPMARSVAPGGGELGRRDGGMEVAASCGWTQWWWRAEGEAWSAV